MEKPNDYDVYFHPDGTGRENPYYDDNLWEGEKYEIIKKLTKVNNWSKRFSEIKILMLPEEEKLKFDRFQKEHGHSVAEDRFFTRGCCV